jgi:hypothetical protein
VHFEAAATISVMALFALKLVKALEGETTVVVRLTHDHLPQWVSESNVRSDALRWSELVGR